MEEVEQIEHIDVTIPYREINDELVRAEKKFPGWPVDPIHGAAILAEEAGEAVKAAMHFYYEKGHIDDLRSELIQTAAMAIRFLVFLDRHRDRVLE